MNAFVGKRKTSRSDMVIAILEKDIRTIKRMNSTSLDLNMVKSILTTALMRVERLQEVDNKNTY